MLLHINMAKGNKDRTVKLPKTVLDDLRSYYDIANSKFMSPIEHLNL